MSGSTSGPPPAIQAAPSGFRRAWIRLKDDAERGAPRSAALRGLLMACACLNTPRRLWQELRAIHNRKRERAPNLAGDRDIEWSWVAAAMPAGPGEALDFGCGTGSLGLLAACRGFRVTALDLQPVHWPYRHPGLSFQSGDLLRKEFLPETFALVLNCSTVEHVGLAGRYGVAEHRPDGDLEAMRVLRRLLKPGGTMLLTLPLGRDAVFAPLCRVYGRERLPRLLEGFAVEQEVFWVKDTANRWVMASKDQALDFNACAGSWNPLENAYALGCFVLKKG